ncbi:MAG: hypothetical protein ORN49_08395 [Rhodobacteraceae bacterium]|nr:hypothetical protein [Paracoccaceae bacterium]
MENIGERLVGDYLGVIQGCDFVTFNLHTPDVQGEIDVVGINTAARKLFICEVVTHMVTGMMYVHPVTKQPDNVARFLRKFEKNIAYARNRFPDHQHIFMLWSPIVRQSGERAKHDQMRDLAEIGQKLRETFDITLQLVCNQDFLKCVNELRQYAATETRELKSPVLRLFQIEEKLKRHLGGMES